LLKLNPNYIEMLTPERFEKLKRVINHRQPTITVVMENIIDPHNLSAVLRTCDAVGVFAVYLIYDGSQPFPKLQESSSASASKWIGQPGLDSTGAKSVQRR